MNALDKNEIRFGLAAARMCDEKGRKFRKLVQEIGPAKAYRAVVREAFPATYNKEKFYWTDIVVPLENVLGTPVRVSDPWYITAEEFLKAYPYSKIVKTIRTRMKEK